MYHRVMFTPKQIEDIMAKLDLNSTELAAKCGVTTDAVRKWLREDRRPSGSAVMCLYGLADKAGIKLEPVEVPA